jgi:hypothetical protein
LNETGKSVRKRKGKEEKMETVNREVLDMHAGREEKRKGKGERPGGLFAGDQKGKRRVMEEWWERGKRSPLLGK